MPVLIEMSCLTPGAWSRVIVHEMLVSAVLRVTVAVRIDLESYDADMTRAIEVQKRDRSEV